MIISHVRANKGKVKKERTKAEGNGETMDLFTFHQATILWISQFRACIVLGKTTRAEL